MLVKTRCIREEVLVDIYTAQVHLDSGVVPNSLSIRVYAAWPMPQRSKGPPHPASIQPEDRGFMIGIQGCDGAIGGPGANGA